MDRVDSACHIVAEHLTFLARPVNVDAYYAGVMRRIDDEIRPFIRDVAAAEPSATARTLAGRYLARTRGQIVEVDPDTCSTCGEAFHGRGVICPSRLADVGLARVLRDTLTREVS